MESKELQLMFAQLYKHYFLKLVRFAYDYVGDQDEAENIVQDLFLQLWEQREVLSTIDNIRSYLFRLTKNRCIDYYRQELQRRKRTSSIDDVEMIELQLKSEALVVFDESLLSTQEITKALNQSIARLPEKCRQIFLLSRKDHLKHKEIAEKLHLSLSTVHNQIGIALQRIKEDLKDFLVILLLLINNLR